MCLASPRTTSVNYTHPPNVAASLMIFHQLGELIDSNVLMHVYIKQISFFFKYGPSPGLEETKLCTCTFL